MTNRRNKGNIKRISQQRTPRHTLYMICEGLTEYNYFMAIRQERRLRTVKIDIDQNTRSGSDPRSLLKYAKKRRDEDDYDDVWCVCDVDSRDYIDEVLKNAKIEPKVNVALSNPCFELWFFLHYTYSTSTCNQNKMVNKLQRYIPDYSKHSNIYKILPDESRSIAEKRACDLRNHHINCGGKETDNPSTNVDILVRLLYSLED